MPGVGSARPETTSAGSSLGIGKLFGSKPLCRAAPMSRANVAGDPVAEGRQGGCWGLTALWGSCEQVLPELRVS